MNRARPRGGGAKQGGGRGADRRAAARPTARGAETAATAAEPLPTLRLGFVRGTAPSKWAERWAEAVPEQRLELVPLTSTGATADREPGSPDPDVLLERVAPGARPAGVGADRLAVRLYAEDVALVVGVEHELAEQQTVDRDTLALIPLLAHPDHAATWPAPEPWQDPSWAPAHAEAAMEIVASGAGAILLPLPLARQLAGKQRHAVLRVVGDPPLDATEIWASWPVSRDAPDVQQLIGFMRGRTARSSRGQG